MHTSSVHGARHHVCTGGGGVQGPWRPSNACTLSLILLCMHLCRSWARASWCSSLTLSRAGCTGLSPRSRVHRWRCTARATGASSLRQVHAHMYLCATRHALAVARAAHQHEWCTHLAAHAVCICPPPRMRCCVWCGGCGPDAGALQPAGGCAVAGRGAARRYVVGWFALQGEGVQPHATAGGHQQAQL